MGDDTFDVFDGQKPISPSLRYLSSTPIESREFTKGGKKVVFIDDKIDDTSSIPNCPVWRADSFYLVKIENEEYHMGYCSPFMGERYLECYLEERYNHPKSTLWCNHYNLDSHFIFPESIVLEKDKEISDGFGWIFKLPSNYKQYQLMEAFGKYSDRIRNALIITSIFRTLYIRGLTLCDFNQLQIYINQESGEYFLNCSGLIRVLGTDIDEPLKESKFLLPSVLSEEEKPVYGMNLLNYALKEKIREQLCVYEYDNTEMPVFIQRILEGNKLPTPLEWLKYLIELRDKIIALPSGREIYVENFESIEKVALPVKNGLGFIINNKQSIHYDGKNIYQSHAFAEPQDFEKIIGKIILKNGTLYIQNLSEHPWRGYNNKTNKVSTIDRKELYLIEEGTQIQFFDGHQKKGGKYESLKGAIKEDHLFSMYYHFVCANEGFAGVTVHEYYSGRLIGEKETGSLIWESSKYLGYDVKDTKELVLRGEEIHNIERIASHFLHVKKEDVFFGKNQDPFVGNHSGNCGSPETVLLKYYDGREYSLNQNYEILPIIRELNQVFNDLYSRNVAENTLNYTVITCSYGRINTSKYRDPFNSWEFSEPFGSLSETKVYHWGEGNHFSIRFGIRPEISLCKIEHNVFTRAQEKSLTIQSEQSVFTVNTGALIELLVKIENSLGEEDSKEEFYISIKKENDISITRYVTRDFIENIIKMISESSNGAGRNLKLYESKTDGDFC